MYIQFLDSYLEAVYKNSQCTASLRVTPEIAPRGSCLSFKYKIKKGSSQRYRTHCQMSLYGSSFTDSAENIWIEHNITIPPAPSRRLEEVCYHIASTETYNTYISTQKLIIQNRTLQ